MLACADRDTGPLDLGIDRAILSPIPTSRGGSMVG